MYPTEKQGGVKQMDYSIVITIHIKGAARLIFLNSLH